MYGRLSLLLSGSLVVSCATAALAAPPSGVAYAGDLQAIDRAVLDGSSQALPSLAPRMGASQPRHTASAIPTNLPPQAAYSQGAYSQGVVPAGYAGDFRPRAEDGLEASSKKPSFFSRLKPSWLGGGDQVSQPGAQDPFVAATQNPRMQNPRTPNQVMQAGAATRKRDEGLQRIPTYAPPMGSTPVSNLQPQPQRVQPTPGGVSRDSNGLALRQESAPRRGLFSSWFGSEEQAAPIAQPRTTNQSRSTNQPRPTTVARTAPDAANPRAVEPRTLAMAPKPSAAPQRLAPRPVVNASVPAKRSAESAGVVIVSDDAPRTKRSPVVVASPAVPRETNADRPQPLPLEAAPIVVKSAEVAPSGPMPKVVSSQASKPTVNAVANPFVADIPAEPVQLTAPQPVAVAKVAPRPMPLPSLEPVAQLAPVAPVIRAPQSYANTTPRPAAPIATHPSERSCELLAEAHQLAAQAKTANDYTGVLKRCRYVLAIDTSAEAIGYANQLSGWAFCKRGEALENEGRLSEAEADFTEALRSDSECWRAEHALGVVAARAGDAEAALRRFNRTLELNPEFAKAYSNRAALAVQKGDYQNALADYTRAIEIDPDLEPAHTGRGRVCHMLGQLEEGLRHLDAAELLSPTDAMIATGRGDLLVDLGRYGEAREAYRRAIELSPETPAAYRNLAWMQATCPIAEFRDGATALQNAEQAEKLAGEADDLTLDTKAAALAALGRYDEAAKVQQLAVESAPDSDATAYRERLALYQQGASFTSQPVKASSYLR